MQNVLEQFRTFAKNYEAIIDSTFRINLRFFDYFKKLYFTLFTFFLNSSIPELNDPVKKFNVPWFM